MNSPIHRLVATIGFLLLMANGHAEEDMKQLQEVVVTGEGVASGSEARGYTVDTVHPGHLGDSRLQDVPFSVEVVPDELVRNLQAANATQALKYVPTVYANTGGSQITPYYSLRGFTASQTSLWNMSVDGMRTFDIYVPVEDKQQIEVMPGAVGFLNGIASPAGMINFVTKRPTPKPLADVTVGSVDKQVGTHLDLGGPLAGRDDMGYRVNLAYGDKGDTGVDHQTQSRQVASVALDWRTTPATRVGVDAAYAKRDVDYAQALFMTTTALGIPSAPDGSRNWGAPYTFAHDESERIGLSLDSRLSDTFSLRMQLRHSDIEREYRLNRQVWQNAKLDYKWRLDSQDNFDLAVNQFNIFGDAEFATGPLRHKVTLGVSHDDYDKDYDGARSQTFATVYPGNLYGTPEYPVFVQPSAGASLSQRTKYDTFVLADRVSLGERWELMLGANRAKIDDKAYSKNVTTGVVTTTPYNGDKTTPVITLSVKPVPEVTAYVSYMEALQQGFTSTTSGNRGAVFSPFVGKQKEVGAKATVGEMLLTAAWFSIEQANQYTDPVTQVTNQDGREIHKGWELTVTGKPIPRVTLVGGITVMDAYIDKATANVGNVPQGVPEKMARLYAEYELPGTTGLIATAGGAYIGRVPWDAANTQFVGSVGLYDVGLRYRMNLGGKNLILRAGINNVTGKDYWTTRSGILYPGEPRTLALSATLPL